MPYPTSPDEDDYADLERRIFGLFDAVNHRRPREEIAALLELLMRTGIAYCGETCYKPLLRGILEEIRIRAARSQDR